jgi:hypothetical protein
VAPVHPYYPSTAGLEPASAAVWNKKLSATPRELKKTMIPAGKSRFEPQMPSNII